MPRPAQLPSGMDQEAMGPLHKAGRLEVIALAGFSINLAAVAVMASGCRAAPPIAAA